MQYLCPTCRSELEQLKACGARDYFCNSCKAMVSRSSIIPKDGEDKPTQDQQSDNNQTE